MAIVSILLSILVRNSFQGRSEIKNCFGKEYFASSNSDINKSWICDIGRSDGNSSILTVCATIVCVIRSCLNTVINTNIPEGFFYFMTFRKMKR